MGVPMCALKDFVKTALDFSKSDLLPNGHIRTSATLMKIGNLFKSIGGKQKSKKSKEFCNMDAAEVPCEFISLPTGDASCQMAQRVVRIFAFISGNCNEDWVLKNEPILGELVEQSKPTEGEVCPDIDNSVVLKSADKNDQCQTMVAQELE